MNTLCPQCKQEIKTSRTAQQNKYWWVCMGIIGEHLGYTPEEISTLIKDHNKWYSEVVNKKTGEILKHYDSSAEWSKEVFAQRTDTVIRFAAEYDIYIQSPEEYFNQ